MSKVEQRKTQDPVKSFSRVEEIARLRLHEDHVDQILNDFVAQASAEFDLPISLVSIVLDDVQKFSASHGLGGWLAETQGTPVEWSFCANSVRTGKPYVVENADIDGLQKSNPLVTIDNVKCYAGAPLISKNGVIMGNFCVIGDKARSFSAHDIERLRYYAHLTMDRIEQRAAN